MKKEHYSVILFALLALLMFAPMLQEHLNIPRLRQLSGVVEEKPMPRLTLQSYRDGVFQKGCEAYLQQHFGYRPNVIRLYNQYLWDFYKKSYVTKGQFVEGKEGWYYEPWFVEEYYQGRSSHYAADSSAMLQQFERESMRLYQLQHILEDYGTHLFVCLLPGKDLIYPEYLPENTKYFRKDQVRAYPYYADRLKELGVNYIDMVEWFLQMKDTADFLLFPQKGTHWSRIASVYAADSILHYMEKLGSVELNDLKISNKRVGRAKSPDNDLEALMNLMRPMKTIPHQYVDVKVTPVEGAAMPRFLVVGDSFYWNIVNQINQRDLFSSSPYWYYNSKVYFDKPKEKVKDLDLVEELCSLQFVMLIYCTSNLYDLGNGFSTQALLQLCYDESEIEAQREAIKTQMLQDDEVYASLVKKAEDRGLSFEDNLEKEVEYLINVNPAIQFKALLDSIPGKRSEKARLMTPFN